MTQTQIFLGNRGFFFPTSLPSHPHKTFLFAFRLFVFRTFVGNVTKAAGKGAWVFLSRHLYPLATILASPECSVQYCVAQPVCSTPSENSCASPQPACPRASPNTSTVTPARRRLEAPSTRDVRHVLRPAQYEPMASASKPQRVKCHFGAYQTYATSEPKRSNTPGINSVTFASTPLKACRPKALSQTPRSSPKFVFAPLSRQLRLSHVAERPPWTAAPRASCRAICRVTDLDF